LRRLNPVKERVLARELAAATTSGAGLAKSQSKVFDPGGGV
jgi:hypothetical protein